MQDNGQTYCCECCERQLNNDRIVWLAHRTSTGTYHSVEKELPWFDTDDDQGIFPFGAGCAKKVLKNGGVL